MTGDIGRLVRLRVVALLAVLAAATTAAPLVNGWTWFAELVLVLMVAACLNLAVSVPTNQAIGSAVGIVAGAWMITVVYASSSSIAVVIPTPAGLARLGTLARQGGELVYQYPAPLPDAPGIRLLIVLGVVVAWWCADVLVGATASPALAGVPLLAIMVPAALLADGGVPWWAFALAGVGYLGLLVGSDVHRAVEWGRVIAVARPRPGGRHLGSLAVIAGVVAVAVVVPALVPGMSSRLIPPPRAGQGGDGMIAVLNPIYSLRDDLRSNGNQVVLTYTTTAAEPEPIRVVTVDSFDGTTWEPTYGAIDRDNRVQDGLPSPPGADTRGSQRATTSITIEALRQTWLPTPYPPTRISVDGPWLYERDTLNIIGDHTTTSAGQEYTVQHLLVEPQASDLAGAPAPVVDPRWTALPPQTPAQIAQTAREVAQEGTEYEKALRLQTWLRSTGGFTYSLDAPPESGSSAILDFLQRKSGYCVHFASTMAVMARSLGIPARVAIGFQPGTPAGDGVNAVRQNDAHAWPELYFSGAGWVRFEPTPAVRARALPPWATPSVDAPAPAPAPVVTPSVAAPTPTPAPPAPAAPSWWDSTTGVLGSISWPVLLLVLVVLVAAAAPAVAGAWGRRRRWRRATSPPDVAEAAWADLLEGLDDLGVGVPASVTVRQMAKGLGDDLSDPTLSGDGAAVESLRRLAGGVEASRYAAAGAVGNVRREDARTVVQAVRAQRPTLVAWRARMLPRSGVRRLQQAPAAVARTIRQRFTRR